MRRFHRVILALLATVAAAAAAAQPSAGRVSSSPSPSPATLWYAHAAEKWENALPVGNGRLGGMVFGRTGEEVIQLNEDTYWSGGPYTTTVAGGVKDLPEIRRLIFAGELVKAHQLFGRSLMGYPVEQQKYQALGALVLKLSGEGPVRAYRNELDLDTAIATTTYEQGGVRYRREVFSSPVDQVIAVRLTADTPGKVTFTAQLRGERNQAHSNYATDYFRMDGLGPDGLVVRGRSADYLGVKSGLRYEARLKALPRGGTMVVDGNRLVIKGADEVVLLVAAATSFVNYKDTSADPAARVDAAMNAAARHPSIRSATRISPSIDACSVACLSVLPAPRTRISPPTSASAPSMAQTIPTSRPWCFSSAAIC